MPRKTPVSSTRRLRLPAAALFAAAAATATTGLPAQAAPVPGGGTAVVASGLDNPRHLTFGPDGTLYIAESGRGGAGPCAESPEGGTACLGLSGAVTSVRWHGRAVQQRRIITGLPSTADQDGSSASGPADVAVTGRGQIAVVIGLGGNPTSRAAFGPNAAKMGTVVKANINRLGKLTVVSDVAAYEAKANPDGGEVDSNPSSILRVGNRYVVADAGGNDLVSVGKKSSSTLAVFPDRIVTTPPGSGLPPQIPMEAVPTAVAIGPDGAYYVSELTGFPFPKGASTIWRVVPGRAPTAYATGLTNVTDLTWAGGKLYAVQLANDGLLAAQGLPMGSLVRVSTTGAHRVLATDLPAPYGVAVQGGSAYVTTCAVCAGGGAVLRVSLR